MIMRTTYKSKVEKPILIPIVLVLSLLGVWLLAEAVWWALALDILLIGFLAYLYLSTRYEITRNNTLRIRSGFLYDKEIYIRSIKNIRPTNNHFASPALSGDRIEIQYNRYERVMISPEGSEEFISQLRTLNPRIQLGESGDAPRRR
jgi:hypothetical protein